MRLIDADKIIYMWQQDRNGKFHDGVTLESIVDNTPTVNVNNLIVEELEKIKQEFEEIKCTRMNIYTDQAESSVSIKELRKLFDKHIVKLKGE